MIFLVHQTTPHGQPQGAVEPLARIGQGRYLFVDAALIGPVAISAGGLDEFFLGTVMPINAPLGHPQIGGHSSDIHLAEAMPTEQLKRAVRQFPRHFWCKVRHNGLTILWDQSRIYQSVWIRQAQNASPDKINRYGLRAGLAVGA
jgi:hypothetical protein